MNPEETKYALGEFESAFLKLKEGADQARGELEKDGVIQRFEFTYELLWKTLKIFLQSKGLQAKTPRDVFREAFRLEWLDQEEVFLNMMEDRNQTSHMYDEETSREIFNRVKTQYIPAIKRVLDRLEEF